MLISTQIINSGFQKISWGKVYGGLQAQMS